MCLYLATLVRFAACMPAGRATQSASKHCFCMIRHPTRTRRTRARSRHCSRQPPAGMACARFCFSHSRQKYSQETRCVCVACGEFLAPSTWPTSLSVRSILNEHDIVSTVFADTANRSTRGSDRARQESSFGSCLSGNIFFALSCCIDEKWMK